MIIVFVFLTKSIREFIEPTMITDPIRFAINCCSTNSNRLVREGARSETTFESRVLGISLTDQTSKRDCVLDKSYGFTEGGATVWVDKGCKGTFTVFLVDVGEYSSADSAVWCIGLPLC